MAVPPGDGDPGKDFPTELGRQDGPANQSQINPFACAKLPEPVGKLTKPDNAREFTAIGRDGYNAMIFGHPISLEIPPGTPHSCGPLSRPHNPQAPPPDDSHPLPHVRPKRLLWSARK